MTFMKLSSLLQNLVSLPAKFDCDISGITLDSRCVKPGYVFIANVGTLVDGRSYIDEAIRNGASIIIAEQSSLNEQWEQRNQVFILYLPQLTTKISKIAANFYQFPANSLRIVGITGTNGKTSCSHFIATALKILNTPCAIVGTLGVGEPGNLKPLALTTPDAITLQGLFAEFVKKKIRSVAMEVSSHSLDQGRVNDIPFEVGVFTNLSRDHLDYHHTMENYGAAKKRLFDSPFTRHAVINADDDYGKQLIEELSNVKNIIAYSVHEPKLAVPYVYVRDFHLDISGITAYVVTPWGEGLMSSSLIGQFNLSNLLATLATLCLMDVPFNQALQCLAKLKAVPGRMQTFGGGSQPLVVVDYSHTPDSLEKVLIALRKHCQGRLLCLFGCGGNRDKGKRPIMASIAESYADLVMVTDDNPRHESSEQIAADIMLGFKRPAAIKVVLDRSKAIQDIIQCAKPGDCVLIAGRGGETHQQIGDKKIPFSDAEKVNTIMAAWRV
jgi:UDP-N-acetylmuramoyl-L-alanyl-D-glutamate--2,6-diaminopimelate ligase